MTDWDQEEIDTASTLGMSVSELRQLRADAAQEIERLGGAATREGIVRSYIERMVSSPPPWHSMLMAGCAGFLAALVFPGWILLVAAVVVTVLLVGQP